MTLRRRGLGISAEEAVAVAALLAGARALSLGACQELARLLTDHVVVEALNDRHDLALTGFSERELHFRAAIRMVADLVGGTPTTSDYQREYQRRKLVGDTTLPSLSALVKHFGGWPYAVAAAGVAESPPPSRVEQAKRRRGMRVHRYPDARLIEALHACERDLGRIPTVREYTEWRDGKLASRPGTRRTTPDIPHFRTIHERFGTWLNALGAAGFTDINQRRMAARGFSSLD